MAKRAISMGIKRLGIPTFRSLAWMVLVGLMAPEEKRKDINVWRVSLSVEKYGATTLTDCQKDRKITSLIERIFRNGECCAISPLIWR